MKSYNQFCGVARALDVVGDRWTLLIVRDLLLGPQRYGALHRSLTGITTNLLAARLEALQTHGLVARTPIPGQKRATYALTPAGERLRPVVLALGAFGAAYMDEPRVGDRVRPRWGMVSLMRRFAPSRQQDVPVHLVLSIDAASYKLTWHGRRLDVREVETIPAAACHATMTRAAWAMVFVRGHGTSSAELDALGVQIEGDVALFREMVHAMYPHELRDETGKALNSKGSDH